MNQYEQTETNQPFVWWDFRLFFMYTDMCRQYRPNTRWKANVGKYETVEAPVGTQ